MQREHVLMLAGEYFVTHLNDQLMALVIEPFAGLVRIGGGFFQNGVRGDPLARNEVLADTEMFQGALGLSAPQFVSGNLDLAKAIVFSAIFRHNRERS